MKFNNSKVAVQKALDRTQLLFDSLMQALIAEVGKNMHMIL